MEEINSRKIINWPRQTSDDEWRERAETEKEINYLGAFTDGSAGTKKGEKKAFRKAFFNFPRNILKE